MKNWFILVAMAVLFLSAPRAGFAQNNAEVIKSIPAFRTPETVTGRGESDFDIDTWVEQTSGDIAKVRPGAFTSNPDADRYVVRLVYKSLKDKMSKLGFNSEASLKALHAAWIDLTIKGFDKTNREGDYTEADLESESMKMGEFNVKTVPHGAKIRIDRYDGLGKTNIDLWVAGGDHDVEFLMDGYVPVKKKINIKSLQTNSLLVELKPIR
jgi:hypothetical protein